MMNVNARSSPRIGWVSFHLSTIMMEVLIHMGTVYFCMMGTGAAPTNMRVRQELDDCCTGKPP